MLTHNIRLIGYCPSGILDGDPRNLRGVRLLWRIPGSLCSDLQASLQAQKDAKKLASSNLKEKAPSLLNTIQANPYQNPPPYEKPVSDLAGAYSRRIIIQYRIVYQVSKEQKTIKILSVWTHYE